MTTMFDATLQLAEHLEVLRTSTATGGSTTTLIDTKRTESDDAFNGGTIWLITDAGGSSAAPEGEWARVTDWVNTTTTATMAAMTAAVASGDTYGIATGDFTLDMMIGAINKMLVKQRVTRYDRTSIDVASDQSEHTLPSGIRQDNLMNVYYESDSDSDDSKPVRINFKVRTAAAGSQHTLIIHSPRDLSTGYDIVLEYETYLSPLYLATDVIDDSIPMARILDDAAASVLATSMRYGSINELDMMLYREYKADGRRARAENQPRRPAKRGRVNLAAGD